MELERSFFLKQFLSSLLRFVSGCCLVCAQAVVTSHSLMLCTLISFLTLGKVQDRMFCPQFYTLWNLSLLLVKYPLSSLCCGMCHHFTFSLFPSALKSTLIELFSPRQPLKPIRRERRKPKPQNVHVTSANIVVRVVRAFNVPTRTNSQTLTGLVLLDLHVT